MKSRVFVFFCLLPTVLLLAVSLIGAQEAGKMRLIGYVSHRPGPGESDKAFLKVLRNLGWTEGQNITIEYRWAARKWDRVPALIEELVQLKVDLIVTKTRRIAQAAKNATTTIPIVMATGSDAVENGIVASLARPGGNITGMSEQYSAMHTKLLELLHETLPRVTRVAFLGNTTSPTLVRTLKGYRLWPRPWGSRFNPSYCGTPMSSRASWKRQLRNGRVR